MELQESEPKAVGAWLKSAGKPQIRLTRGKTCEDEIDTFSQLPSLEPEIKREFVFWKLEGNEPGGPLKETTSWMVIGAIHSPTPC